METVAVDEPMTYQKRQSRIRSRIFIMPRFQLLMLSINFAVMVIFSAVLWISVHNTFLELEPAASLTTLEGRFYKEFIEYQLSNFKEALLIATGVAGLVSSVVTIVISHRLAGPLVRLGTFFESVAKSPGKIPLLTFRDSDYLRDLPTIVNAALERVQQAAEMHEDEEQRVRKIY